MRGEPDGSKLGTRKISLDGGWSLSFAKQPREEARTPEAFAALKDITTIDAIVPGNAEIDLQRAGLIDDPMVGDNIFKLLKFEAYQWKYARQFRAPKLYDGPHGIDAYNWNCILDFADANGWSKNAPKTPHKK